MRPDPRRTADAVRQVRLAYPNAYITQQKGGGGFAVFSGSGAISRHLIGQGQSVKGAWWNAVPKALAHVLAPEPMQFIWKDGKP